MNVSDIDVFTHQNNNEITAFVDVPASYAFVFVFFRFFMFYFVFLLAS